MIAMMTIIAITIDIIWKTNTFDSRNHVFSFFPQIYIAYLFLGKTKIEIVKWYFMLYLFVLLLFQGVTYEILLIIQST